MRIDQTAAPPQPASARASRRGRSRGDAFAVPAEGEDQEGCEAASPAADAPALVGLSCVLTADAATGLKASGSDAAAAQAAARQGRALLGALAGLQLAALGGDGVQARQTLSDLARALPESTDPRLDEVLRAIAQRAAIELARAG